MKESIRTFWYYTLGKYFCQRPPVLTLFVTNRCNARCQHCFYWQSLDKKKKAEISLDVIKKLSLDLNHLELLMISGGEPFLRDDLVEIVKIFWQNNSLKTASLASNFLLPQKTAELLEKIVKISPKLQVIVCPSLDGTEKVHDKIRGVKGAFDKFMQTYQRLTVLQKKYKNLRLRPNGVVFNLNCKDLFKLIDQMPKLFAESWLFSLSLIRGERRNHDLKLPEQNKLKKLFAYKFKKFKGERSLPSRFLEKIIFNIQLKILQGKKQLVPCEAGRLMATVFEDGSVSFCELLGKIGNLKEKSFAEIWQSKKAKTLRKKVVKGECFCTHECMLCPSLIAHPLSFLKGF